MRQFAIAAVVLAIPLAAQQPFLVRDINTTPDPSFPSSSPGQLVRIGKQVFFDARIYGGRRLFVTDGTTKGTRLVRYVHQNGLSPNHLTSMGGRVYFASKQSPHEGIWTSDGTVNGTRRIEPEGLKSGQALQSIESLVVVGSKLFFRASDGNTRDALWVTDGTDKGTHMVGFATSVVRYPLSMVAFGGKLYCTALTTSGYELVVSDGTTNGARIVKDIQPGTGHGLPRHLTVAGSWLYFEADDGKNGRELWRSDGSAAGTTLVADLAKGSASSFSSKSVPMAVLGTRLVFQNSPKGVPQLWISDGTASGTMMLADLTADYLKAVGTLLYFRGYTALNGRELWRTDGTPKGTFRVSDSLPGTANGEPFPLGEWQGKLLFSAASTSGREPWISDGTVNGTRQLADLAKGEKSSNPGSIVPLGNRWLFAATDSSGDRELWTADTDFKNAKVLADILDVSKRTAHSNPRLGDGAIGELLFSAYEPSAGAELMTTQGTAAATRRLRDLAPGSTSSTPRDFVRIGNQTFFIASPKGKPELWRCDGTAKGTVNIFDPKPASFSNYDPFRRVGNLLFFDLHGSLNMNGLWCSDGTPANTFRIGNLAIAVSALPLVAFRGRVWFQFFNDKGNELWSTDGTAKGTRLEVDVVSGKAGSDPQLVTVLQDKLIFVGKDSNRRNVLYATDGSKAGTQVLASNITLRNNLGRFDWSIIGDKLVFRGSVWASGAEPWVTDGTPKGTFLLRDIVANGSSTPSHFVRLGSRVMFQVQRYQKPRELWQTDGTSNGTTMVRTLAPFGHHYSEQMYVAGDQLLFVTVFANQGTLWSIDSTKGSIVSLLTAYATNALVVRWLGPLGSHRQMFSWQYHPDHGTEVWVTDGTKLGTRVLDVFPGPHGTVWEPSIAIARGLIYWTANHPRYGRELFAWNPGAYSRTLDGGCGDPLPPALRVTDPHLGKSVRLEVRSTQRSKAGLLAIGGLSPRGFAQVSTCRTLPDLTGSHALVRFVTNGIGDFSHSLTIPNLARLAGLELAVQAAIGPTGRPPIGTDISNAVYLRIGR